jgi:hypothetical protein
MLTYIPFLSSIIAFQGSKREGDLMKSKMTKSENKTKEEEY